MKRLTTALSIALCVNAAHATTMFGIPDCGQWVNQHSLYQKAWLAGFLSGLASMDSGNADVLDRLSSIDQAYLWMDNWCHANPLRNIANGGNLLYLELRQGKR